MIGAIIGDIVGSRFEWHNIKTKKFELFHEDSHFTDDSVLTIAIGTALLRCNHDYSSLSKTVVELIREIGRKYPHSGYGHLFYDWLFSKNPVPYFSYGNGAPMRVSSCGIVGRTLEEVKLLSKLVTEVTHNHVEGMKAAEAVAVCVFFARQGKSKLEILEYAQKNYYPLRFTLDQIRPTYHFDGSSQGTTPQALMAFFESTDYEDAIRNAISIGGDSDTIGAITGAVAGAFYGVPESLRKKGTADLDDYLKGLLMDFEKAYPPRIIEK
jgi:type I restriction enzyme M protein